MTAERPVLLRLLSGLNAGASMELAPGEWLMGSGDACDLLVTDPGISERHLALRVAEDGAVRLVPLDGEVLAESGPVPADGMALDHFAVFSAGMLSACIGPAGEPWPEVRPLTSFTAAAETDGAPETADTPPSPPETAPAAQERGNLVGIANRIGNWPRRRLAGVLAFLFLAVVLCIGIYPDGKADTEELTLMLHEAGFPGAFAEKDGDVVRIQGLVPSNAALDSLGLYVSGVAPEAAVDVLSVEAVAQALQAKVVRADAALRVSRAGSSLRIAGYVFDMDSLKQLFAEEEDLLRQVPTKVDVITWKQLAPALTRLIQSRDLKSRLRVIPGAYRIAVQAQALTPQQQENLAALLIEAEASVGDTQPFVREEWEQPTHVRPPAVKARAPEAPAAPAPAAPVPAPPAPAAPVPAAPAVPQSTALEPLPQKEEEPSPAPLSLLFSSQSTGALQCGHVALAGSGRDMAILFDGIRYRVGAKLPNGYQVRAVTPEYVVFQIGRRYTQICTPKDMNRETKP